MVRDERAARTGGARERRARPGAPDAGSKLARTPGGAREPVGRDRAVRRHDAPPRSRRQGSAPPRPELPVDEEPQLPRGVRKEIDRVVGGHRAKEVALALSIGSVAIEEERVETAREMLAWAKDQAPRIAAIREAYGVALYLDGEYASALSELKAYRRMTSRVDQNHLIADCMRAVGRDLDLIVDTASSLVADRAEPDDRRVEAAIVWAAALAAHDDVAAGRAVLRRVLDEPRPSDDEPALRLHYFAAELAAREGDREEAGRHLQAVLAVEPEFLEAEERLRALWPERS